MQIYCVSHLQGLDFDLVRRESPSQFCSKPKRKIIIHLDPSQLLLLSRHAKLCLCIENGPHAYIIPFFFFKTLGTTSQVIFLSHYVGISKSLFIHLQKINRLHSFMFFHLYAKSTLIYSFCIFS